MLSVLPVLIKYDGELSAQILEVVSEAFGMVSKTSKVF